MVKHGARRKAPTTRLREAPYPTRAHGPYRGRGTEPDLTWPELHPPMPDWFRRINPEASGPEYWVWHYLTVYKHMQPGADFVYQDPVLGGRLPGGQVLDFVILNPGHLAIFVDGDYWHRLKGTPVARSSERARDDIRQRLGWDAVIVWESSLIASLQYTLEEALKGHELLQAVRY